ncbi:alpha/beta-hydrolase [Gymnopus androsaceus JB14]|uniref:Alpha/beta-hydrolase n=1 Tax=Gymnopus androsaceus JB14 TaxID=1447944 RepID=A0A6A4HP49_9AGAR|nr:alpha/beta-hydrolase [Gymnopus androsaceus JB14]
MSSFKISISSTALSALKSRLELTTFPDELDEAGWDYGVPLADIKRLVARWRDGFDWRKEEQKLNETLPQFTRDIEVDGFGALNIHYVHKKSEKEVQGIPLLFVHGWPGSFLEARKIIPLLTKAYEDSTLPTFDVVALSLPGYGFSEGAKKKGFSFVQYAEVAHKLMLALGYKEYVTQGGDWGFNITREIARRYGGKHAKAWHVNFLEVHGTPSIESNLYTPFEKEGLERLKEFMQLGSGYNLVQSTKPQTLGYSLADSPVGLLAWIYEKLVAWADNYPWTDDEVLTWVSIYWFSRAGPAASIRIYYEDMCIRQGMVNESSPPTIPLGTSIFPKEFGRVPKSWYPHIGNAVFEAEHNDTGGHFAAYEQPKQLVADLQQMFGKGGPAYGVVSGQDGYGSRD